MLAPMAPHNAVTGSNTSGQPPGRGVVLELHASTIARIGIRRCADQNRPLRPSALRCGMRVNPERVYRSAITAHRLPQGLGAVPLPHLALAFSQMAKDLRSQDAPAELQEAFQTSIAQAVESTQGLTATERTAVRNTLFTAFDGLPRRHAAMSVRSDFLRQVRFSASEASLALLH